ncbi:MAG TPA: ABC transporter ATP-binding protein [Acidobacteriota bacterium]|nr:ABC transporter ATP-binding protein [Acidobacteriota bacterium]
MSSDLRRRLPQKYPLVHLAPYLRLYRGRIAVGILMVLLTNAVAVVSPWVLGLGVGALSSKLSHSTMLFYGSLIVVLSAVEGVFRYLMRSILIGVSRRIEYDLRNDVFRHLQLLHPRFYQLNPTGDIMSRATNDLSAVRMVLGPGIMYSVNTLFTTVLTVSLLLTINLRLALLTLIPLVVVSYTVKCFGKHIHDRFEKIQEQLSVLTSIGQENVAGVRVVKAYNQEEAFIQRFAEANGEYLSRSLSLVRISGIYSPLLAFLLGLSSVGLLWYGGRLVIQGTIGLPHFVAFMAYLAMLTWPTIALGWVINIFERGSASMARIRAILDTQPEITDGERMAEQDEKPFRLRGEIEVRDLTFSYNGTPVLANISFRVPAGSTLAIVGATGSGKSTLANLLVRLYQAPRGTVFIDGIDINDIPLKTLRQSIGYVPQDTFLFSETIRKNIAFGEVSAPMEQVEEAAKVSNIWPDIQTFPDKFDTFVGERGITLSGGQKQRIAISRALLIDPRILILDDSLSSVDTQTEESILQRLSKELRGRTAILISHRISTVKSADQILVLKEGRIVERGTHDELLRAGGQYAGLYEKQLLREELEVE